MVLSAGQRSDFKGAEAILHDLQKAKELVTDKDYVANWFREALAERKIKACIPSKSNRKTLIPHDKKLSRQRHKIENMLGHLEDWRRINNCYGQCAHTFMSAIYIATTAIFWL